MRGATRIAVSALSVLSLLQPLPVVHVSIRLLQTALARDSVHFELAIEGTEALPLQTAAAVPLSAAPLPGVAGSVLQHLPRPLLEVHAHLVVFLARTSETAGVFKRSRPSVLRAAACFSAHCCLHVSEDSNRIHDEHRCTQELKTYPTFLKWATHKHQTGTVCRARPYGIIGLWRSQS